MTDLPHILPAITSIGQHLPEHNHKPTVITNQLIRTFCMLCPHLNQTGISLESCEVQGSASCLVCMVNICSTIQQALRSLHSATQTCPTQGSKSLPVLSQHTCTYTNSRTRLTIMKWFNVAAIFRRAVI